jgi:hypothetical protein
MTNGQLPNPFNVTKAADFSDREIKDYWVDLPGGAGFREMAKPTARMPMLIMGGKGSGKTHLMRYFSYPLQKLRHDAVLSGINKDGYIGIYLRCGGLNAARFTGKGQDPEKWEAIFSYYMDLWLAQLVLEIAHDVIGGNKHEGVGPRIAAGVSELLDQPSLQNSKTIASVLETFQTWQREIDSAVNNAAISRQLSVTIRSSPGRLPFGVPRVLATTVEGLANVQFLYLIDELENLGVDQQRYVNTLVREREDPCSFKLGARLYGIKTFGTYSAGEINKEGSEYEKLSLDDRLRDNPTYKRFAKQLIAKRLTEAGYLGGDAASTSQVEAQLESLFETQKRGVFAQGETDLLMAKLGDAERPYFEVVRTKLTQGARSGRARGIQSAQDVEKIIELLRAPAYPLLEKANLHRFYKAWGSGRDLGQASREIAADCAASIQNGKPHGKLKTTLSHFQGDLLAQLYADMGQRPLYLGVDTFIEMSRGLPRNLLVVLKHVVQWAVFNGESPFRGEPISRKSQQKGVREAASWFFRDAEVLGEDASNVQDAVQQLANLFRGVRYSDKPAECSLSTFSTNLTTITPRSREIIDLAENWSLLLRVRGGQRERNTRRVDAKYQLNSMLAPIWDLPISRRGALSLSTEEANAIFDPEYQRDFETLLKRRIARMTAPAFDSLANPEPDPLPLFTHR